MTVLNRRPVMNEFRFYGCDPLKIKRKKKEMAIKLERPAILSTAFSQFERHLMRRL